MYFIDTRRNRNVVVKNTVSTMTVKSRVHGPKDGAHGTIESDSLAEVSIGAPSESSGIDIVFARTAQNAHSFIVGIGNERRRGVAHNLWGDGIALICRSLEDLYGRASSVWHEHGK